MSISNYIIPLALFVLFAHPATFKAVRGIAGGWIASGDGLPKLGGLVLHGALFVWLVGFLMRRVSFYGHPAGGDYVGKSSEAHRGPALGMDNSAEF
jgi:hypothetical protein